MINEIISEVNKLGYNGISANETITFICDKYNRNLISESDWEEIEISWINGYDLYLKDIGQY